MILRPLLAAIIGLALATAPAAAETVTGLPIVVDGDSLRFPGVEVRVHGIDAPELHQGDYILDTPKPKP